MSAHERGRVESCEALGFEVRVVARVAVSVVQAAEDRRIGRRLEPRFGILGRGSRVSPACHLVVAA